MDSIQIFHHPLEFKRVAVRPKDTDTWQWFGQAIAFTPAHYETAMAVLEDQCAQAAALYPTHRIHIVIAPSKEAFDALDMSTIGS